MTTPTTLIEGFGTAYGPHRITNTGEDIEHTALDGGKYGIRAFECGRCHKRAVLADFAHGRVTCTEEGEAGWSRERADALLNDVTFKGATAYAFTTPNEHGQARTDTYDRPTAREVLALWLRAGGTFNWHARELRVTCFGAAHSVKPSAEESPATHGRMRVGEHVAVGELGPGDTFVTRCAFTVLAIAEGTFTALGYDGQTITQTVPEGTRVLRIHRAPGPKPDSSSRCRTAAAPATPRFTPRCSPTPALRTSTSRLATSASTARTAAAPGSRTCTSIRTCAADMSRLRPRPRCCLAAL